MKNIYIFFLSFLCASACLADDDNDIHALLDSLDLMISKQDIYIAKKEDDIAQVRSRMKRGADLEEQYTMNSLLYDEYYVYDADTALNLAKRNLAIADKLGKKDWTAEWNIKASFVYAATGLLNQAIEQLHDVSSITLPINLKIEYYRQLIYIYSHLTQYAGSGEEARKYANVQQLYVDSICKLASKEDPLYLWQKAWGPKPALVKDALVKAISGSEMDTRYDAMNAYCLSHIYELEGNQTERIRYMIYSAMADLRCCNRDIAAMEELAKILFAEGDIDHSYTFINYCMENDRLYHNRVHMISLSEVNKDIHDAYLKKIDHQKNVLRLSMVAMGVMILLLAVFITLLLRAMKKLRRSREKVNETNEDLKSSNQELENTQKDLSHANDQLSQLNSRLTEVNTKLTEANSSLSESNYVKEEIIGYVFSICSQYISKQEDFRKKILRQLKTNKIDELKSTVEEPLQQKELKEFYQTFDQVFLNIYPDFIDDFNALLRPEERIIPKEGELLNTELRIYALVRLGINDSVKISEFLHCSVQTVYNNRLRCRNKALIEKSEFAKTVQKLGITNHIITNH